jgi:hypothetical protein
VQILISTVLPLKWAVIPALVLLLNSIITTLLQLRSPSANPFVANVVPGRATSQLLDSSTGSFHSEPGTGSLVVFNLGVQWNHPLGSLAPGVAEVSRGFRALVDDLYERREELGFLCMSPFRGMDRGSNQTLLFSFYFRDVESVHRFAHEPLHREAWDKWTKNKQPHIGLLHETFSVPEKGYENLYINCHPAMLGRGDVRCRGDGKGGSGEKWVNTLVSADIPTLKTQYARLSREENGDFKKQTVTG